jgi:hypothetical protein
MNRFNFYNNKELVQDLLWQINYGFIDPKLFDPATRQRWVERLVEGYSPQQISQILRCSIKTLDRDLREIHIRCFGRIIL